MSYRAYQKIRISKSAFDLSLRGHYRVMKNNQWTYWKETY